MLLSISTHTTHNSTSLATKVTTRLWLTSLTVARIQLGFLLLPVTQVCFIYFIVFGPIWRKGLEILKTRKSKVTKTITPDVSVQCRKPAVAYSVINSSSVLFDYKTVLSIRCDDSRQYQPPQVSGVTCYLPCVTANAWVLQCAWPFRDATNSQKRYFRCWSAWITSRTLVMMVGLCNRETSCYPAMVTL